MALASYIIFSTNNQAPPYIGAQQQCLSMKRIASFSLLALLLLSCTKEPSKERGREFTGPVATLDATKITQTSAILNGEVDPSELVQGAKIGFFLSTNENPSHENSSRQFKVKLDKDSKFYYEVKGLEFGTQYFFKAFIKANGTYREGDVRSFSTPDFKFAAVDLGLSVKWANCNVGANAPEGYGDFYAFGETEIKAKYDKYNYKWYDKASDSVLEYNYYSGGQALNGLKNLLPEDDVAHVKFGGKWRIPRYEDWKELFDNCSKKWTERNGVMGAVFTARNGNSIFIPASGSMEYGNEVDARNVAGQYWSATVQRGNMAFVAIFDDGPIGGGLSDWERYNGYSVRPVTE